MFKRDDAGVGTRHWTADEARAVLRRWAASGLTKTAFAEQQGFTTERLRRWEKRLADGGDEVELRLVPVVARETSVPTEGSLGRLHLPGGLVLELDATRVDPRWVAALVLDVARGT
jgi:hypothetical protein